MIIDLCGLFVLIFLMAWLSVVRCLVCSSGHSLGLHCFSGQASSGVRVWVRCSSNMERPGLVGCERDAKKSGRESARHCLSHG